jgi:conjugative relaxase-like TrwC/TraI family protein
VVQGIADGVEEYYAGGAKARCEWMGAGARQLELVGAVDGEHLRVVLEGLDSDGRPLRDSACAVRVAGYDLTFSAPESVRVLFGLGDPGMEQAVRAAHDRAVRDVFGHARRRLVPVRGIRREIASS